MIILGKSEAALIMIQDILESRGEHPVLEIVNNLKIFTAKEYIHTEFTITEREDWELSKDGYVIGAMMPKTKKSIFDAFTVSESDFITLAHKSAQISKMAKIGVGGLFDSGCAISGYSEIGNFATIYPNVVVSHHCKIGNFATLCPSASLAGNVEVGDNTFIGIGAVVKNGVKIGSNCVIGAGAVVVKGIPDNSVVKGNPAK